MPREQITQQEIMGVALFGLRAKMYKCMPGIVHSESGTAEVDVQPAVHDVRFDVETGERFSEPWPVILGVPVAWPQWGGGQFAIVGTLKKNDKVLLLSYDLDPSLHRGTGNAEDPVDTSRHSGAYWIALPCDITDKGASALGTPGESMVLGKPGGVQVQIGASSVSLGGADATDFVALASLVATELGKISTTLGTGTAPSGGGPVVFGTTYAPGSVASATVKCAP